jgi:UPF0716 protein FxsA
MGILFLLFIALPLLDLVLLVRLAPGLGIAGTVALLVVMGALGVAVARRQGQVVVQRFQQALSSGRVPEGGILDRVLALVGAVFLITPGVITDVLGLLLLLPFLRAPLAALVARYLRRQIAHGNVRIYGLGTTRDEQQETEVGRAHFRPGEVIDTQGEEIERKR